MLTNFGSLRDEQREHSRRNQPRHGVHRQQGLGGDHDQRETYERRPQDAGTSTNQAPTTVENTKLLLASSDTPRRMSHANRVRRTKGTHGHVGSDHETDCPDTTHRRQRSQAETDRCHKRTNDCHTPGAQYARPNRQR